MLNKTLTNCRTYATLKGARAKLDDWSVNMLELLPADQRPKFRIECARYLDHKGEHFCTRYIAVADFTGVSKIHPYIVSVLKKRGITSYSDS